MHPNITNENEHEKPHPITIFTINNILKSQRKPNLHWTASTMSALLGWALRSFLAWQR